MKEIKTASDIKSLAKKSLFNNARQFESSKAGKAQSVADETAALLAANRPGLLTEILNQDEPYRMYALSYLHSEPDKRINLTNTSPSPLLIKTGVRNASTKQKDGTPNFSPILVELEANESFDVQLNTAVYLLLQYGKEVEGVSNARYRLLVETNKSTKPKKEV